MKSWIIGIVLIFSQVILAQEFLVVPGYKEKVIRFAAYAQDSLQLHIKRLKGSKLQEMHIRTIDGYSILELSSIKKYNGTIVLPKTAVYEIVLVNNKKKEGRFTIEKKVHNAAGKQAKIVYKVQRDTTYGYPTTQFRTVKQLGTTEILHEKYYLHSRSNALLKGGKNRVIIPLQLPEDIKEWYLSFTASRSEKDIKNTMQSFNLAAELSGFVKKSNNLQQAMKQVYTPPGANICDLYLFDENNARAFKAKEEYTYIAEGTRENIKSGTIRLIQNTNNQYYLGINNPDNLYGLHIAISAVGITNNSKEIEETINIPIITSYAVPVVK